MNRSADWSRRGFLGATWAGIAASALSANAEEAAPAVKPFRNPSVYRFQIGSIEAFSISDCNLPLREGLELMWPVEDRPKMKELMEGHGERLDVLPLYVNLLVLRLGNEVAVFDAGFGPGKNPEMGWFLAGLASVGIRPEQVTATFLSHGHADHLNGFVTQGKPTFPNAAFYLLPAELDFWRGANPDFSKSKRDPKPLPNMVRDVRAAFDILQPLIQPLKPGTTVLQGAVTIEEAPGHTAGHACFRIRSGNEELLHLMDLAHHHLLMFADPEWTIAFDHDPQQSVVTRKKFWAEASQRRVRCFGFHLPWPGIGRILPVGNGYQWYPERLGWGV